MNDSSTGQRSARPIDAALDLARNSRLYPSVILHGASEAARRATAVELARTLLCEAAAAERPCGHCRQCERIDEPGADEAERFHPDFAWLDRDLKTSTSAESTRDLLRAAQLSPFEARGQVFVIGDAGSLSPEASDSLLKVIEEPGLKAPRHFLLLAPSRADLAATLRSRSLAVYLGAGGRPGDEDVAATAQYIRETLVRAGRAPAGGRGLYGLGIAARLAGEGDFTDARAAAPWTTAALAVRLAAQQETGELEAPMRRRMLELADTLLGASSMRLRGIPAERILEGLVARHLF